MATTSSRSPPARNWRRSSGASASRASVDFSSLKEDGCGGRASRKGAVRDDPQPPSQRHSRTYGNFDRPHGDDPRLRDCFRRSPDRNRNYRTGAERSGPPRQLRIVRLRVRHDHADRRRRPERPRVLGLRLALVRVSGSRCRTCEPARDALFRHERASAPVRFRRPKSRGLAGTSRRVRASHWAAPLGHPRLAWNPARPHRSVPARRPRR